MCAIKPVHHNRQWIRESLIICSLPRGPLKVSCNDSRSVITLGNKFMLIVKLNNFTICLIGRNLQLNNVLLQAASLIKDVFGLDSETRVVLQSSMGSNVSLASRWMGALYTFIRYLVSTASMLLLNGIIFMQAI